jgi:hypothetical protein
MSVLCQKETHAPQQILGISTRYAAAQAGHVDVGQNQDQRSVGNSLVALQCGRSGQRELHDEATRTKITPEMLPEHALYIGLVIDDKNVRT